MIKNASIFTIELKSIVAQGDSHEHTYTPCTPTQEHASGWIPPRGEEHGSLSEIGPNGIRMLKMAVETRKVPGQAVRAALDERVKAITAETGRKPGAKRKKELKAEIIQELLPKAFSKVKHVTGWIDQNHGLLVIDTASPSVCDLFISLLIKSLPDAIIRPLLTESSPAATMTHWLLEDTTPDAIDIGRACALQSGDSKATVRFKNHTLDVDDVASHIRSGKHAISLEVSWRGRVQFTLTEDLRLRGIKFLDLVFEENTTVEANDAFDADVAITTGEIAPAILGIIEALGGQISPL